MTPSPRIGVGITTRNRADLLEKSLLAVQRTLPADARIVVVDDHSEDRTPDLLQAARRDDPRVTVVRAGGHSGIARVKNLCLKGLLDRDAVFLLDDDCYPVREGWAELYAEAMRATGVHHFQLHQPGLHKRLRETRRGGFTVREYLPPTGVFLAFTGEAIARLGALHEGYGLYGLEHEGYTNRAYRAGLHGGLGRNLSLAEAEGYLCALDFTGQAPSVLASREKRASIRANRRLARYERHRSPIHLPFDDQPPPPSPWWARLAGKPTEGRVHQRTR